MKVTAAQVESAISAYPNESPALAKSLANRLMDLLLWTDNTAPVYFAAVKGDASREIEKMVAEWNRFYDSPIKLDSSCLELVNKFAVNQCQDEE